MPVSRDASDEAAHYVPGACNIGPAEIRQRQVVGWTALAVTVGLWIALGVFAAAPIWRLALFVPASIAATGFLQAASHFCATYGVLGVSNVGPGVGKTERVRQAADRHKDRRAAIKIIAISVLSGVAVAATAYFIPL